MSYPFDGDPKWDFKNPDFQKRLDNFVHSFSSFVVVGWKIHDGWDLFRSLNSIPKEILVIDEDQSNVDDWIHNRRRKRLSHIDAVACGIDDMAVLPPDSCLVFQDQLQMRDKDEGFRLIDAALNHFAGVVVEVPNGPPTTEHKSSWYEKDLLRLFREHQVGSYPRKVNWIAYG